MNNKDIRKKNGITRHMANLGKLVGRNKEEEIKQREIRRGDEDKREEEIKRR